MHFRFFRAEYKNLPRSQSAVSLMNSAIFIPVILFSLINHQEPRFLIPITVPIILLHSPKLQTGFCTVNPFTINNRLTQFLYKQILSTRASAKGLLRYWYLTNIFLTIFFGFIHQGGIIPLTRYLSNSPAYPHYFHSNANVDTHLVTSHIYNIPMSLIYLPSTKTLLVNPQTGQKFNRKRQFYLYEYGNINMLELHRKVKLILDISEMKLAKGQQKYKLYLAMPASLTDDLTDALNYSNNTLVKYQLIREFYPHLSTEAMPKLFLKYSMDRKYQDTSNNPNELCHLIYSIIPESIDMAWQQFASYMQQFSLVLYRIEVRRKKV